MNRTLTMAVAGVVLVATALLAGCETMPVKSGAAIGGALGAGTGAIIGHQSGHAGEGALIGAGVGALTGAIAGDAVKRNRPQPQPVYQQPLPPATPMGPPAGAGHYENRIVRTPSGNTYEERVWVAH
jgi:uncharacterized membrane protein YebE (DUF533 family)